MKKMIPESSDSWSTSHLSQQTSVLYCRLSDSYCYDELLCAVVGQIHKGTLPLSSTRLPFSMAAAKKRIWSWIIRSGFYRRGGVQRRRWTVANASYTSQSHYISYRN